MGNLNEKVLTTIGHRRGKLVPICSIELDKVVGGQLGGIGRHGVNLDEEINGMWCKEMGSPIVLFTEFSPAF